MLTCKPSLILCMHDRCSSFMQVSGQSFAQINTAAKWSIHSWQKKKSEILNTVTWLSLILTKLFSHTEKYIFYLHLTILSCYLKFMASEAIKKKWNCRFVKIKRFSEYSVQYTVNVFIIQTSFVKIHNARNVEEIKLKNYKKNFCENRKQTNEWTTIKSRKEIGLLISWSSCYIYILVGTTKKRHFRVILSLCFNPLSCLSLYACLPKIF